MQFRKSLTVDCSYHLAAMFVLVCLVAELALTQALDLSSQLGEHDSFSFVQSKDDYTIGKAIVKSSEIDYGDDSSSEREFKMPATNTQELLLECSDNAMKVVLPAGSLNAIRMLGRCLLPKAIGRPVCGISLVDLF